MKTRRPFANKMAVEARKRRVQQDVENNVHMQRGQVDVQSVFTCKGIILGLCIRSKSGAPR